MDTILGNFDLTKKQIEQLVTLKNETISGFSFWNKEKKLIAVSNRNLSESEKDNLIILIKNLPDSDLPEKILADQKIASDEILILSKMNLSKDEFDILIGLIKRRI